MKGELEISLKIIKDYLRLLKIVKGIILIYVNLILN